MALRHKDMMIKRLQQSGLKLKIYAGDRPNELDKPTDKPIIYMPLEQKPILELDQVAFYSTSAPIDREETAKYFDIEDKNGDVILRGQIPQDMYINDRRTVFVGERFHIESLSFHFPRKYEGELLTG